MGARCGGGEVSAHLMHIFDRELMLCHLSTLHLSNLDPFFFTKSVPRPYGHTDPDTRLMTRLTIVNGMTFISHARHDGVADGSDRHDLLFATTTAANTAAAAAAATLEAVEVK